MRVKKRSGKTQKFNADKIRVAIGSASESVDKEIPKFMMDRLIAKVEHRLEGKTIVPSTEISKIVEDELMNTYYNDVARAYIENRHLNDLVEEVNTTDTSIIELLAGTNDYWNHENSNKDSKLTTTLRDYIAGITSTDIARRILLSKDAVKAHDAGIIHIHDMDYIATPRNNCCLCNLEDMLQNGTTLNGVKIEKPHRFVTAMTIATQIITAVSSCQYGGITVTMTHLAPFVRSSFYKHYKFYVEHVLHTDLKELNKHINPDLPMNSVSYLADKSAKDYAMAQTMQEVEDGVQTFNYQVNSMSSTNGQAPFLTVCLDIEETDEYRDELAMIIEEFLKQRILGMKNEQGVYVTVAFPKLVYVLSESNIHPESKYWYLTELSAKCTAKRMVPDYVSKKKMQELKINKFGNGDVYPPMGCRSFLTPDRIKGNPAHALNYDPDKPKYYGRFNAGVVTLSLPDLALSSKGNLDTFWKLFEERTELCHRVLKYRLDSIAGNTIDSAPILWKDGAFARLTEKDSIKDLLYGGYATVSLGYAGLYECVKFMTGHSHTDEVGKEFGLKVMQALNDKCNQWKKEENVDYSIYGTPIESTTYKFARCLKERFGKDIFEKLDGKDRDFITNSYHVFVEEEINPFEKIAKEAEFQALSPGGAITYIETADLTKNTEAVIEVMKFIYENIVYAELNTKSDYCQVCGSTEELEIIDENGQLVFRCKHCGNTDQRKLNYARRVCGYISTNEMNNGRMDEIRNRYIHLDNHIHN